MNRRRKKTKRRWKVMERIGEEGEKGKEKKIRKEKREELGGERR